MKTALQQIYDELERFKSLTDGLVAITDVQRMIGNLYLETEKNQIIEAYIEGYSAPENRGDSERYYASTFINQ